jgi:hypothetical protein
LTPISIRGLLDAMLGMTVQHELTPESHPQADAILEERSTRIDRDHEAACP